MSVQNLPSVHTSTSVPAKREFPKIDLFFDAAIHIAERSEELLSKGKPLLVSLFLFIETLVILIYVLTK
jgi:hypothetical protein